VRRAACSPCVKLCCLLLLLFLMQADAISSFVAAQRKRTQRTATKSAWGVAAQQLSAER
jgi:hypothetical protein